MTNPPTPELLPCPMCDAPGEWVEVSPGLPKQVCCIFQECLFGHHSHPLDEWNSLPRRPAWQPIGWVPTEPGWYWNRDPFEEPRKARMTLVGRSSRGLYVYGTFFPSNPLVEEWKRQWSNRIMEPVETRGKEGE